MQGRGKEGLVTASFDPRTCRVALLAGGKSSERTVSLASGEGAREALETAGFPVTMIDPARKDDLKTLIEQDFDVAFLCLHGKYGEDGTVQGMLEILGIPYTGPGVWSSALAIDKAKSKVFYERARLNTPASVTLYRGCKENASAEEIVRLIGKDCVVKVAKEGSTIGVFMVHGAQEVADALDKAFAIDDEVIVERFVAGRELTVAVIGNDDLQALPVIEIVPKEGFYDYEAKYAPGGSKHLCPAPLSAEETERVTDMALRAHKALSCRGMSRSDVILEEDGTCWLLETNTLPGMTGTSLLPDAARVAGISFPELCTKLVGFALEGRGGAA